MKKLLLLPVLLFAMGFASCSKEDDTKNPAAETLTGEWSLRSGNGTIAGRTDEFADGEIVWSFNDDNTVDVVNTVTDPQLLSGLPSGTYSYTVQSNQGDALCPKTISVGNGAFACSVISANELRIDDGFADGVVYVFAKVPEMILF